MPTVTELKEMCKKRKLKNYSKLKKNELLLLLKKDTKKIKKQKGGNFNLTAEYLNNNYPKNIKRIDLSHNEITSIESNAFNGFSNLTWLILNNNKITTIEKDTFTGLSKLIKLDFIDFYDPYYLKILQIKLIYFLHFNILFYRMILCFINFIHYNLNNYNILYK